MRHEDCDWAIAGECDYCGHRTNPDNLLGCHGHEFCDEECKAAWESEGPSLKIGDRVVTNGKIPQDNSEQLMPNRFGTIIGFEANRVCRVKMDDDTEPLYIAARELDKAAFKGE